MAQIKGTAMLQCVKVLRAHRDAAKGLLPEELHPYLEKRIAISVWYPESDHLALIRAVGQIIGADRGDLWEFLGRASAKNDLTGVYRNMLKIGDTNATLRRGPALWQAYHDTGRVTVTWTGEHQAKVELADYGLPSLEMCGTFGGYYTELLHLSGARESSGVHIACRLDGAPACLWQVKWTPAEADAV
jgi:hypothetical protein